MIPEGTMQVRKERCNKQSYLSLMVMNQNNDQHGMITLKVHSIQHSLIVRKTYSTGGKSGLLLKTW